MRHRAAARAALILSSGAATGYLFSMAHLPLPWTLGAMVSAAMLASLRPGLVLPPLFRNGARPVIGVVAGSAFTPAVVSQMPGWWPVFAVLIVFFVVITHLGAFLFRLAGFDRPTALLAAMPGGLGEMTLLGDQFGADIRKLVLVHSVRIILVISSVPFITAILVGLDGGTLTAPEGPAPAALDWAILMGCIGFGYLAGRRLAAFGGLMLVPLLFSAIVHATGLSHAELPYGIVAMMQVVIGSITGARFVGIRFREARTAFTLGLGWAVVLIAMSSALALGLAQFLPQTPAAFFLALSPGGFNEMVVMAYAAGVETAFVVACHAFRTVYILLVSPMLCRLQLRSG